MSTENKNTVLDQEMFRKETQKAMKIEKAN